MTTLQKAGRQVLRVISDYNIGLEASDVTTHEKLNIIMLTAVYRRASAGFGFKDSEIFNLFSPTAAFLLCIRKIEGKC